MQKIRPFHHFVLEISSILQPDWSREFWPISQEPEFSQVWDLCKNTANIIKFIYRLNSEKINDSIFQ